MLFLFELFILQIQCFIYYTRVSCTTAVGTVPIWYDFPNDLVEFDYLKYPSVIALVSPEGSCFLVVSYGAYGSGIFVGDYQTFTQTSYDSPNQIVNIQFSSERKLLYILFDIGVVVQYHYTPNPFKILTWQEKDENQKISKVIIFEEDYKYIILSKSITLFDYFNQEIYKVKQFHTSIVTGAVIDKIKFIIISFNQDDKQNLFAWSYKSDEYKELVGHTAGVNGAELIDNQRILLTYSNDGYIIIWDYYQGKQIKQYNLHNKQPIQYLYLWLTVQRQLIISKGGDDKLSIFDYKTKETISQITLKANNSTFFIDTQQERIFISYQYSLYVYSYITGVKITELLGFDDFIWNIIFEQNYMIAHSSLVIQSFNRQSLKLLKSDKSNQQIYKISLLRELIGMISDSKNAIIKIWNYKSGTMLQDIELTIFPTPLNGIISDRESNTYFVRNINNEIFIIDPYAQALLKMKDFYWPADFTKQIIIEILIEKKSNLLIVYNDNCILEWKYYFFLGKRGQETSIPSNSKINLAYNIIQDQMFYADFEKNLWMIQYNSQKYIKQLVSEPLQCVVVGEVLIIRFQKVIKSYNHYFEEVTELQIESYKIISDPLEIDNVFIVNIEQDILQIGINQKTFSMVQKQKYLLNNGVSDTTFARVQISIINNQYKHLIVVTQNQQTLLVNYSNSQIIAKFKHHSQRVMKVAFNSDKQKQIFYFFLNNKFQKIFIIQMKIILHQHIVSYIQGQDNNEFLIFLILILTLKNNPLLKNNNSFELHLLLKQYKLILFVCQVQIKKNIKRLVSCSADGLIGVYSYTQNDISLIKAVSVGGEIEEILLDIDYGRLLYWQIEQTKIFNLDLNTMKANGLVLGPGDCYLRFEISQEFNKYAIFNLFQINIYERKNLSFFSKIRFLYELKDIQSVKFISDKYVLVNSLSSIRIYKIIQDSDSELIITYLMTSSQIISFKFENNTNLVNIKGMNYQTAFNYTFTIFDSDNDTNLQNLDKKYCYTNIYNSINYFLFKKYLELQQVSIEQFNFNIKTVNYNLIYQTDSHSANSINLFFPESNSTSSGSKYQNLVVYQTQENNQNAEQNRVQIDLQNSYLEYTLETLTLQKFSFYFEQYTQNQIQKPTSFHQNTKIIIFNDGLLSNLIKPLTTQGFLFQNVTTVVLETLTIKNVYFDGIVFTESRRNLKKSKRKLQQNQQNINSLFSIITAKNLYIKSIIFDSCIFKNQNIFFIQNAENVFVDNIKLTNITFKSSSNNILSVFQIINSKNIRITNINIKNIHDSNKFNVFSMYGNIKTEINIFKASQLINSKLLFYTQFYNYNEFEYKVKNDTLTLISLTIDEIEVEDFSQLDIQADTVNLIGINAKKIKCLNCDGAVIKANALSFILKNSLFTENQAIQGGAIFLEACWRTCQILSTRIERNTAKNGGGLFLKNTELFLQDVRIHRNNALIGGGIRYIDLIPSSFQKQQWKKNNNVIEGNEAEIFGKNIASYPRNIILKMNNTDQTFFKINNSTSDSFSNSYVVSNFMSGDNFIISVQLIDEEDKPVKINISNFSKYPNHIQQELRSYQIESVATNDYIQLNSERLVSLSKYDQSTYSFVFDKLVINGKPLSENYFYLKTHSILIPNLTNSSHFYQPDFSAFISIQFRKCKTGELYMQKQAGQLEYCKKCPDKTYSLIDPKNGEDSSLSCEICPDSANFCKENIIQLKEGFWRLNNSTSFIIPCSNAPQNCIGEQKSQNYCQKGYVGPLCENCDIEGEVWGTQYAKVGQFSCQKCKTIYSNYIIQAFALIFLISYILYGVKQTNQVSKKIIIGYYMRMMNLASVGTSDCQDYTSVLLKFLMHYLYISSIIKRQAFKLPFAINFLQIQISTPIDSMKYVPDCYHHIFNGYLKPVNYRLIVSQMLPFFYLSGMSLIYFSLVLFKKVKYSSNSVYSGLIFLFLFIQPDLLNGIIAVSSCRYIGGGKYITDDISQKCLTSEHLLFLMSICLPFFILWAIIIPIILLYSIYRVRKTLYYYKVRIRYGFLYQEYKLKTFYWEFLKLQLKLLVTIIDNFLRDEEELKLSIIILLLTIYLLVLIKKMPYFSDQLNKCDRYSHIALIIILQMNLIIILSNHEWLSQLAILTFFFLHYSLLVYLIVQILNSSFRVLFTLIVKKCPYLSQKFPFLFKQFKISNINRMTVYKNWKKIWRSIQQQCFTQSSKNKTKIFEKTVVELQITNKQRTTRTTQAQSFAQSPFYVENKQTQTDSNLSNILSGQYTFFNNFLQQI